MNNYIFTKLANARKETDQYLKQLVDANNQVLVLEDKVQQLEEELKEAKSKHENIVNGMGNLLTDEKQWSARLQAKLDEPRKENE